MTAPIPIASSPPQSETHAPPARLVTPASSASVSPQTPFSPLSPLAQPLSPSSAIPTTGSAGFLKLFSPTSSAGNNQIMATQDPMDQQKGFAPPPNATVPGNGAAVQPMGISFKSVPFGSALDDHEEEHDSFEFGDVGHARAGSWGRRAMSMSASSPPAGGGCGTGLGAVGLGRPSGIAAMLKGLGSPTSPGGVGPGSGLAGAQGEQSLSALLQQSQQQAQGMQGVGAKSPDAQQQWAGMPEMSPLSRTMSGGKSWTGNGVLADKAARGQGLLRRLSIGTGGSLKPGMFSPLNGATSPPAQAQSNPLASIPQAQVLGSPQAEGNQRSASISGPPTGSPPDGFARRGSMAKKRSVSPMGERILRDHGHF